MDRSALGQPVAPVASRMAQNTAVLFYMIEPSGLYWVKDYAILTCTLGINMAYRVTTAQRLARADRSQSLSWRS